MSKKTVQRSDDADAFIRESEPRLGLRDDLALRLAEDYLRAAASGDEAQEESTNELLVEELGGPFIESSPEEEFGAGRGKGRTDPADEASALPQAVGPLAIASLDEKLEAAETREELGQGDGDSDVPEMADLDDEVESRTAPSVSRLHR